MLMMQHDHGTHHHKCSDYSIRRPTNGNISQQSTTFMLCEESFLDNNSSENSLVSSNTLALSMIVAFSKNLLSRRHHLCKNGVGEQEAAERGCLETL